jgi:hypothetical protein
LVRFVTPPRTRAGETTSEAVAFWVPLLAAVLIACLMPASPDTYWQLRAGRDIAETGHVSLVDRYSYTAAGSEWPDHEWLWQLASAGAYAAGGMPLLTALAAAFVVAALAVAHRLTVGPWWTRVPLFAATIVLSCPQWSVRPKVFTLLALTAVTGLVGRRRLLVLPAIFLVWANVHGGVVLGFVPLAVGLAVAIWRRERRLVFGLLAAALACGAATLATPLGPRLYSFIGESMRRSHVNGVAEWRAATAALEPGTVLFFVAAAALVAAAIRLWRRLSTFEDRVIVGTALALVPLSFGAVRNIGSFALLAFPAATRLLAVSTSARVASLSESLRRVLEGEGEGAAGALNARRNRQQIVVCGAVVAGLVAVGWARPLSFSNWQPISEPARAAIASCPGQVYNEYNEGGYLVWFVPEKPVFIDGRQDPYSVSFLALAQRLGDDVGARVATFDRYGIRCAALAPDSHMASSLLQSGWQPRYRDRRWVVLSR